MVTKVTMILTLDVFSSIVLKMRATASTMSISSFIQHDSLTVHIWHFLRSSKKYEANSSDILGNLD